MSPILLWAWSDLSLLALLFLLPILALIIITRKSTKSLLPPCPPKLPLIGNLHQLGSLPHQSLHALSQRYGHLMLLRLGEIPTLIVSSADTAQEIMRTYDHIFASRPFFMTADILLYGGTDVVFAPHGEHWRQMRKICVNHLLSTRMVQTFRSLHEEEVASMVAKISKISLSSGTVNMSEVLNWFGSAILFKAISRKYFREEDRAEFICKLIEENVLILGQFSISDFMPSLALLDVFFGMRARATRNAKRWDDVLDEIIEVRSKDAEGADDPGDKNDFVNVLLSLQRENNMDFSLSRDNIKAILQDMIAAGTETTFITLDWVMAELVQNSKKLKKLQDEVRGIAKCESIVREEDLRNMSYLKAVIKEVLRLHPPVPLLIPRESMDHCKVQCKVQGYEVPKKTRVLVNAWSISRDPKAWEAPEEFRPERFIDYHVDFRGQDFEFIPFGAGRRICPGMQFAASTLELALANLVHRFDWELLDGLKGKDLDMDDSPGLTARRKQNLHLVAKPFFV